MTRVPGWFSDVEAGVQTAPRGGLLPVEATEFEGAASQLVQQVLANLAPVDVIGLAGWVVKASVPRCGRFFPCLFDEAG